MARVMFILIGVLAGLFTGVVALFTLGTVAAVVACVSVLGLGIYAAGPTAKARQLLRASVTAILVLSLSMVIYGTANVARAFTDLSGPVEPADPQALSSAQAKIDQHAGDNAAFRLELTEQEITAVLQDGLASANAPFRQVVIDVVGSEHEERHIEFSVTSRNGELSMRGILKVVLDAGVIQFELLDVDMGKTTVPGLLRSAIADLINPFTRESLAKGGTEIQAVRLLDDRIVIVGTQAGGKILSSRTLLTSLERHRAFASASAQAPRERLGPGVVNALEFPGSSYYVALGDSLAANVGVDQPRDGYVSRFHNQLQQRDQAQFGLRNFAVPGETSASLIRNGQLEIALQFIQTHDVRYITIDIGANDLLGHLSSADCSETLSSPECNQRIVDASGAYEINLVHIFRALRQAAPLATVIFLETYNPLSLGFEARMGLEAETNRTLSEFNNAAAIIAGARGVLVADGFTPLKGTTGVTTHMLDDPPDIHPKAIGYDMLAAALVDALE